MEFSRAVALACFISGKWLMLITGILFLLLSAMQHWRNEAHAQPHLTIGTGISCLLIALLLYYLAKRIEHLPRN